MDNVLPAKVTTRMRPGQTNINSLSAVLPEMQAGNTD